MADITPVLTHAPAGAGAFPVVTWETLTSSDANGTAWVPPRQSAGFASVQVTGTPDSATVLLQGSNDGTNWATLKDADGNDISMTAAGMVLFMTAAVYIRPSTSGGGGSQDIDVIISARG